jgi:hypothetical protein
MRSAMEPAGARARGVEARRGRKHAGQVAALHHGELAVHVGEANGPMVPGPGKGGGGDFAEDLHGAGAEAPQGFKAY